MWRDGVQVTECPKPQLEPRPVSRGEATWYAIPVGGTPELAYVAGIGTGRAVKIKAFREPSVAGEIRGCENPACFLFDQRGLMTAYCPNHSKQVGIAIVLPETPA